MMLIRVTAPHFCAGIETGKSGNRCAPILRYMRFWNVGQMRHYCERKGWTLEVVAMT